MRYPQTFLHRRTACGAESVTSSHFEVRHHELSYAFDVRIHITRRDLTASALVTNVLKELLAGKLLQLPHHVRDPSIAVSEIPFLSRLALETEFHAATLDPDVAVAERRQAKRFVHFGIGVDGTSSHLLWQRLVRLSRDPILPGRIESEYRFLATLRGLV